ncbi:LacI family DNA-binding transcriptional regulator [Nocardiopsis composta]|uniref:DNA-binding LacI/PurR family transcriptional regulator n=2 Tax=Nocardiopsis composta TaxID=157465 RepID=A0A7W8QIE4_9ACTN|nr:LacI family DNA-binding transcriptional regulator [Nocardiopsis composta]MBB5430101.1 DNA-binding LacI/PurR family transcriptional regulator [Nocardiopsis composta]
MAGPDDVARLDDVAREAGVSASTVSRAMSRPDMVAPATLARVRDAAERLGFRANPAARALITGRTGFFALLVPDLDNPFYAATATAAQDRAAEAGRRVIIAVTGGEAAREAAALADLEGQVDGFAVLSPMSAAAALKEVHRRKPVVAINRRVSGLTSFTVDTPGGLGRIYDRLVELGHRDVAYLAGPPGSWMDRRRRDELVEHAARSGLRVRLHGPVRPAFAEGAAAAREIAGSGCTAVLVYNSLLLLGMMFEFGRMGVRVPEDVSVAAADDIALADLPGPQITAVLAPAGELGRCAVAALAEMVGAGGADRRPAGRRLPTGVRITDSLAPPRAGA